MTDHSARSSDDTTTAAACGILAATLAAFCHEALGHALACYVEGGQVTLLTSIWFRCRGAGDLTDAAGSMASLAVGLMGLAQLWTRSAGGTQRLALALFCAFSLFWFAGQLIVHPLTNADDWAIVARRSQWPWFWRPVAVVLGSACYLVVVWSIAKALRDRGPVRSSPILIGYAAGAASAALAGAMWAVMPMRSAIEGVLTLGIAPLGILAIAASMKRYRTAPALPILRSPLLVAVSATVFVIFLLVQGSGLGSLASIGLPR